MSRLPVTSLEISRRLPLDFQWCHWNSKGSLWKSQKYWHKWYFFLGHARPIPKAALVPKGFCIDTKRQNFFCDKKFAASFMSKKIRNKLFIFKNNVWTGLLEKCQFVIYFVGESWSNLLWDLAFFFLCLFSIRLEISVVRQFVYRHFVYFLHQMFSANTFPVFYFSDFKGSAFLYISFDRAQWKLGDANCTKSRFFSSKSIETFQSSFNLFSNFCAIRNYREFN
jgi:hypothetical protein